MRTTPVDDPEDPRLEPFRATRDGAALERLGLFIAEGEPVVRTLIGESRFETESVLVERKRLDRVRDALEALPESVPVYAAEPAVVERLVGFPFHRGVLAAGRRGEPVEPETLIGADHDLLVALENVNNHDNVGAVFRNAAAFDAGAVLLDPRTCDPLYRKSVRVSMGHALRVPFARARTSRALNGSLRDRGYTVVALTPAPDAEPLASFCEPEQIPERVCLLLGAEGPGLSEAAQRSATARVRIEMAGAVDSLNVATAGAIALHAIRAALSRRAGPSRR